MAKIHWFLFSILACGCTAIKAPVSPMGSVPTYSKDVAPIVLNSCVTCHSSGGVAEYFPLDTYANLKQYAQHIKVYVHKRLMPPWKAVDVGVEYKYDYSLGEQDRDILLQWLENPVRGSIINDKAQMPAHQKYQAMQSKEITGFNVVIKPPRYKPKVRSQELRCFVRDWPLKEPTYITNYHTGHSPNYVHHSLGLVLSPKWSFLLRVFTNQEMERGFDCYDPRFAQAFKYAQFLFSTNQPYLPLESGFFIEPGAKFILQYHFETNHINKVSGDLPPYRYKVDPSVKKRLRSLNILLPNDKIIVPKNKSKQIDYIYPLATWTYFNPKQQKITSLRLHAHNLFVEGGIQVVREGRHIELLRIKGNIASDTDNYILKKPFALMNGDVIRLFCRYDNTHSNPYRPLLKGRAIDVFGGWFIDNEMCSATLMFVEEN